MMKTLLHILCLILLLPSCRGHDDLPRNPIDELPPETHIGAQTFGCLIDGRAFLPKGSSLYGPVSGANYQYVPNSTLPNPVWVFQVFGNNNNSNEAVSINLGFLDFEDLNANTYILSSRVEDGTGGGGIYIDVFGVYDTTEEHTGFISITHYDYDNRIISGTFEFDVEVDGEIVHITDGRFDMKFY